MLHTCPSIRDSEFWPCPPTFCACDYMGGHVWLDNGYKTWLHRPDNEEVFRISLTNPAWLRNICQRAKIWYPNIIFQH